MNTTIKTKLILGLVFLFFVIICFGTLGIFYVNRLSTDAGVILKDNHVSVEYCSNMMKALDRLPADTAEFRTFEHNLDLQERNITEPGEFQATSRIRMFFEQLKANPPTFTNFKTLRSAIFLVEDLNQKAIIHKNSVASRTARQANLWFTIIVCVLSIVAFTFVLNFPAILIKPIRLLNEGIQEIARKNYSKRIHLDQDDEFGRLAQTFNVMAEKLDEYEHSNLAEIKLEKTRIEAIINKMNDGIIGLGEQKEILFINSAAEKLFGLRAENVSGRQVHTLAADNDLMRAVLEHQERKQLKIAIDQKEAYFDQETIDVQTEDGIGGQVIILRNVTPFKELDAAKTNFIATISHELKTPLFAIKMSAKLLEDARVGTLNDDQQQLLTSLNGNVERIQRITAELLNMSQVETGQLQLRQTFTQPQNLVQKALEAVQQHAQKATVSINSHIDANLPSIYVDEEKTIWVLINLLSNAIKFSHAHSKVDVFVQRMKNEVRFTVTDYGRGIEPQFVPQVFDKYFKVPGTAEKSGTGLGLSISKDFIEAQAGKIWVNSEFGAGSSFGFNIQVNA